MLPAIPIPSLFITGTDTGVGKTLVSATLLAALNAGGRRALGMKPVASGCIASPAGWRSEDALALLEHGADRNSAYSIVNPYTLEEAVAVTRQEGSGKILKY